MNADARSFIDKIEQYIAELGTRDWIEVYNHSRTESGRFAVVTVFVPESEVNTALRTDSWGIQPTQLVPGCIQYSNRRVRYLVHGNDNGFQPLILRRYFYR